MRGSPAAKSHTYSLTSQRPVFDLKYGWFNLRRHRLHHGGDTLQKLKYPRADTAGTARRCSAQLLEVVPQRPAWPWGCPLQGRFPADLLMWTSPLKWVLEQAGVGVGDRTRKLKASVYWLCSSLNSNRQEFLRLNLVVTQLLLIVVLLCLAYAWEI